MSTSQPTPVRGRFAPSPSGRMHLGNLCCALLAWLSVRSRNGEMLLRIEDLDPNRCTREKAELLMDDLSWLGLTWDEGPGHERTHAPYCQSARRELYESALSELRAKNDVYPCFCTRAELHAVSAPHAGDGTFRYPGLCRNLTPAEAEEKSRTRRPSLRFRAPDKSVTFEDLYCGPQSINVQSTFGDFIVRRSDGVHAYQLAVTVDDALMGVTEVIRGRDLLPSTGCQIQLFHALGHTPPHYGHIPLLVNRDGRRLSKRERDLDIGVLRTRFTPEQLLGRMANLLDFLDRPEKITLTDLIPVYKAWYETADTPKFPKNCVVPDNFAIK